MSVAVAVPVSDELLLSWQLTVALAGQVIAGAVTSCTVMVWLQLLLLSVTSVAVHVLVIV